MSAPEDKTESPHVYLVDDDPGIHETIGIACEMAGIRVTSFLDETGLLDQFVIERPEVVLLDYGLAKTAGTELARQLRAASGDNPVRLILLTGYRSEAVESAAEAAGIQEVLHKPVSMAELIVRLSQS